MRLRGRVALITGAAGDIGRAAVTRFLAEGASLFLTDIDGAALEAVRAGAAPGAVAAATGDLTDPAAVRQIVEAAVAAYGRIDILYNNAGLNAATGYAHLTEFGEWQRLMDANLTSTFLMCRAALPYLSATRGVILNTASTAGVSRAGTHSVAYPAAKAGVLALTRSIAAQYGPAGVRANCLVPGVIEGAMSAAFASPRTQRRYRESLLLGRPGRPSEVASVALFLASDDASYLTGAALVIDGGWSLLAEY